MNRRGFFAALMAIPAAVSKTLRQRADTEYTITFQDYSEPPVPGDVTVWFDGKLIDEIEGVTFLIPTGEEPKSELDRLKALRVRGELK